MKIPKIGLRNIKTALAVVLCLIILFPFWNHNTQLNGYWDLIGATNAVIAAIICMQNSIESSWKIGLDRMIGTVIGGVWGCIIITLHHQIPYNAALVAMIGLSIIFLIWFCLLIGRPGACNLACIVFCVVVLTTPQDGAERYMMALFRMGETAMGIIISVLINYLLPGEQEESK